MNSLLSIFSWVASALVEGLCPGTIVVDNIAESLRRYNESATKIAETMQRAWRESLGTLKIALGDQSWLSSKSRKQFGEKFAKEVITPFALQRNLTGKRLDRFLKKALKQCEELEKVSDKIIDFTSYDEDILLNGLTNVSEGTSSADIGGLLIQQIQDQFPDAQELLQLLWYRNLLLEGLVAHFNMELSLNSSLADLVDRLDRQRIQRELQEVREQMDQALKKGNYSHMGKLGPKATQLAAAEEVYVIDMKYQDLLGPIMERLNKLSQDHDTMNEKLDEILNVLTQLQQIQKVQQDNTTNLYKIPVRHNVSERQLADQLSSLVKNIGWKALPENYRVQTANSLTATFYSAKKISQSINILEEVIREGTTDASIYFQYFEALQAVGRYQEAVKAYHQAIALKPELAIFPPTKYEMISVVGKGETGIVYQAKRKSDDKIVAIKAIFMCPHYQELKEKIFQGIRGASKITHSGIVDIYECHLEDTSVPIIVMEYLNGPDLHQKVKKQGAIELSSVLEIADLLLDALKAAHEMEIIHPRLKPSNIVYTKEGPKIIGFDSAKFDKTPSLNLADESYYTIYYSSPEQLANFQHVTKKSNIYSLGKILCYLLIGEDPYDIDWDEIPLTLRSLLRKATKKTPEHRYDSMAEMQNELHRVMSGEVVEGRKDEEFMESGCFIVNGEAYENGHPVPEIPIELLEQLYPDYELIGQYVICKKDNSPMVYVPSGKFLMGDDSDEAEIEEAPLHEIELDGYLIDIYPVTNARYALFLEEVEKSRDSLALDVHPTQPPGKKHIPQFWYNISWNQENHPVVGLDWWDAYAYCQWAGKSLPTEAEWEKAARGTEGKTYPWGDDPPTPQYCNFNNFVGKTTPVGVYPLGKSPYGCFDMVGNVWEWCHDWYDATYYKRSPRKNPFGPASGRRKVGRGGSWQKGPKFVRTTTRGYGSGPAERLCQLGFRTVKRITLNHN